MKCRGGSIINLGHESPEDGNDVFLYMTCDVIMNVHAIDELVSFMHDNDINILIIGGRGQYDKCSNRVNCKSGVISKCYSMTEAYAVLSLIDLDSVFKTSPDYMMKEIVRMMSDRRAKSDVIPKSSNVHCIYPCIAYKCPRVIKSTSDMEDINIYCMPDKLTASSIDPVYYFFAIVIIFVVLCVVLACWITVRRMNKAIHDTD